MFIFFIWFRSSLFYLEFIITRVDASELWHWKAGTHAESFSTHCLQIYKFYKPGTGLKQS